MGNANMMQPHYEIIYRKVVSETETKQMNLDVFFDALETLAEIMFPQEMEKVNACIATILKGL